MHNISNILEQIRQQYVAELPLRIDKIESLVLELSDTMQFQSTFDELYRETHSLKGTAGMHNLHILSTISHHFENQITPIGGATNTINDSQTKTLLQFMDLFRLAIDQIINNETDFSHIEEQLAKLSLTEKHNTIKILIVESSKTIIDITQQIFADYPVAIILCRDGYEALKILLIEHYELLITNTETPVLNGIALIAALKHSEEKKHHTYTMLLTSKQQYGSSNRYSDPDYTIIKDNQFIENFSTSAKLAIKAILKIRDGK